MEDLFPFASFLYVRIFGCCLSKRLKAWDEEHHVQKKDKMLSSCQRTNTKNDDIHCCAICAIGTPGDYHSFQSPFIYFFESRYRPRHISRILSVSKCLNLLGSPWRKCSINDLVGWQRVSLLSIGLNIWCSANSISFKSHSISGAVLVALCMLEPHSTDSLGTQYCAKVESNTNT